MVNPLVVDPWIWKNPGPFRAGERVLIPFGTGQVEGTVVEDRGNLGDGGKTRLYRIMFTVDDVSGEMYATRAVDEMTLVERAAEPAPKRTKKKRRRE
jgi:hypothetical protein